MTVLIVVTLSGIGLVHYWNSRAGSQEAPTTNFWEAVYWRAGLVGRKAIGRVPGLSWSELWVMSRAAGGFGLGGIVKHGGSIEGSITNPYVSEQDNQAGARIFESHCSRCHGDEGSGGHGPPLHRPGFSSGDSDFAIYRVIRDGIPGTAMIGVDMNPVDRWQTVGYLRQLQLQRSRSEGGEQTRLDIQVSSERIRAAGSRMDEWVTYSGSLNGQRFTPLAEITPDNVSQLRLNWVRQLDTTEQKIEATPLVIDGTIYVSVPPAGVAAITAKSGRAIWTYKRSLPPDLSLCCGMVNRGVALLGSLLFVGTLDGFLVALDANTGEQVWEKRVAESSDGYTLTGAPLIANDKVIVGVAGGEFGIRGFVAAYDPLTGREIWRFFAIPGPGEPGHETWENSAWKTGGGATWVTGSFDPSLGLIYWGVGNPSPNFAGDVRPGDNLYTDSVIALDAESGELVWHFQFTPHDEHDWDSAQTPILADLWFDGKQRKVICWANRNGFYYILDRVTGEFLAGKAFADQNWAEGLDSSGRPIPLTENMVSTTGRLTKPGLFGASNWENSAFDPMRGLVFVPAIESASVYTKSSDPRRGRGGIYMGSAATIIDPVSPVVRAIEAATGEVKWERFTPFPSGSAFSHSGLLATGSGLVFGASGGFLFALDSNTGQELWRVYLGGGTSAAPISFNLDGRQVVTILAGRALFVFTL